MVRTNNEDTIALLPQAGLAILADGMGGHQAGEVASGMAVEMIKQYFSSDPPSPWSTDHVREAIQLANTAVFELSQQKVDCAGMGTTIIVVYFDGNRVHIGHVGDSRLYRLRNEALEQITEDHSVVQELVSRGFMTREEANTSMNKNLVTRALGIEAVVNADLRDDTPEAGDIYLMCSDGLSDVVPDDEIRNMLLQNMSDLDVAVDRLIGSANEAGGPDNISVVLLRTAGETGPE
jgi:protein phosphatase